MLRPVLAVLMGGASGACGFAALGVALYAPTQAQAAAELFAGFGFASGALCALLTPFRRRLAAHRHAELAGMVRATLASAAAEQPARSGTAAQRRPTEAAAAALAAAAVTTSPDAVLKPTAPAAIEPVDARRFASSSFGA